MKTSPLSLKLKTAVALIMVTLLCSVDVQADTKWQPVASDTLITLPANMIEKRIEQDFNASPLATRLLELDSKLYDQSNRIQALQQDLAHVNEQQAGEIQYELVQQKSAYLDTLQESHQLRKDALIQKQQVYQDVLLGFRQKKSVDNPVKMAIQRQQKEAQTRMEAVMSQVDQNLMHSNYSHTSPYADEYAANLAQIEQLKSKINQHNINAAPTIDGTEVSSEEYIRQLLHSAAMHQSLLDQEALMLSYMARLVALDAQALEHQLAFSEQDTLSTPKPHVAKASLAVGLFL